MIVARSTGSRRLFGLFVLLGLLATLQGCASVHPALNAPLQQFDPKYGYRFVNFPPPAEGSSDSLFMIASFSGGGTRASTLAFGALRELARTQITWEGKQRRLLDELNAINALSGGSFTAAYYGLYGDRIFHDFESRFLRKDWESELKSRVLWSPYNWARLLSPYFGRAHILAELLDEALFEGHTYGDMVARQRRPLITIHASDMATLARFEFMQSTFDLICSDLTQLPIARATAASSALPLVLSPISLKNYAGTCGYEPPVWLASARKTALGQLRADELRSYLDAEKRPMVHLLDGGLSDNVGMRGMIESAALLGDSEKTFEIIGVKKKVRKLVYLVVNAETSPDLASYRFSEIPALGRVMSALIDIPINRYSTDTLYILRQSVDKLKAQIKARKNPADSKFAADADVYLINASLSEVEDPDERDYLMKIPTTLYLTDEQIERLLLAASRLIRTDPEFQRLMRDLEKSQ